ncbi:MAG: hypothetical protein IKJ55_02980, partial [Clostridia bacterium]|nr:hypothetical protein [Clostridia bacterium]
GNAIYFHYDLENTITISLASIHNNRITVLESKENHIDIPLSEENFYLYQLKVENDTVSGSIAGVDFAFDVKNTKGKLAIERVDFIGELLIESVGFTSNDTFETENIILETKVDIPLTNGGDIPYTVSWEINKVEDEYYLTAKLDGGVKTRKVNREDRPGQYAVERDWMTDPYIGIGTPDALSRNFCIAQGEKAFIDPNIFWECQKGFFGDTELPIVNTYKIPEHLICDEMEFVFGYADLDCTGFGTQRGGSEFRFTPDGKLIYEGGKADGSDIYELYSQEDKVALSFVPEDCYKKEDVIWHIKYNHYFDVSEDIEFTFVMQTMTNPDFLEIKASVINVYETETLGTYPAEVEISKWKYGYNQMTAKVHVPKMEIGVYKAEFVILYGGKEHKRYVKVFEVFDQNSDENPALKSGLPFIFSMPNEQKWLMRNAFDLWTPMKSCDVVHYYNCATDTPVEATIRKQWKLNKKFKREWFLWLASRTCKNWQDREYYRELIENCDYLFLSYNEKDVDLSQSGLFPFCTEFHLYQNFMRRAEERVGMTDEFLKLNPEIAEKVDYKPGMEFTFERYLNMFEVCASEWIAHQNKKGLEYIKAQNEEIAKVNPNVKRSLYGPINMYVTPTLTNHSLQFYCTDDYKAVADDIYTGFTVFEDYPFSCAYQTYRAPFTFMTLLLHAPKLRLYPEQYSGSKGGCIDGAVKFAHPPMGQYSVEPYQVASHAFEYVFNTAYKLEDGYHYWDTYGFHRGPGLIPGLVLEWKYVVQNKPKQPLKAIAYLAEYTDKEDYLEVLEAREDLKNVFMVNPSEIGHGLIHECTRECGVPNGFALKADTLKTLSAKECDVLVVPNIKYAEKEVTTQIRRLYNEGVNLIAVSDVTGLEDLFGVEANECVQKINCVCCDGEKEFVREHDAKLLYKPISAEKVMTTESGEALIVKTDRTVLINTSVTNLGGSDLMYEGCAKTPFVVGKLIRKTIMRLLRELSTPLALGENVGVTLFETEDNRKMLLAMDYTPFDNKEHSTKEAIVKINMDGITDAKSDRELFVGKKDGIVKELRFNIREHESVFIELFK